MDMSLKKKFFLMKGGGPAARSRTATLLRLRPSHQGCLHFAKRSFRPPRLPWRDGRCVQGAGTYSPPYC